MRVGEPPGHLTVKFRHIFIVTYGRWPAPGFEDTELGVFMGPEVRHGEAEVHARVQA